MKKRKTIRRLAKIKPCKNKKESKKRARKRLLLSSTKSKRN
jgi:hypothetical protein